MPALDLSFRRAALIVWIAVTPAYALFGLKWPWAKSEATKERVHTVVAGQKIRTVRLLQANPADLIPALENYLQTIHSDGYVLPDAGTNGLIITDAPENLDRLEMLAHAMDHAYDNPNARARQIQALREMQKALHGMAVERPSGELGRVASASPVQAGTSPGPAGAGPYPGAVSGGPSPIYIPPKEDVSEFSRMLVEERPVLRAFQLVGWFRDSEGVIAVLRNSGQRYIYRRGHLLQGSLSSKSYVKGIHGAIRGNQLVLEDADQGTVTLSMVPEHGHYERIR